MITKLNPNVIQDGSITAEKLADGIANDIISSLSTQSTLPSLTDYYIGQNAGGRTETYFKKTLQSIGSVFQHELYDKVYLKDGSDPTFGNITAWQLNLSENSYVTHADGFGLALSVNDCAFLVGEEGGVYYLDDAGNTQTMLHSGNIGNYKSGDSAKLGGYGLTRFLLMTGRDYTEMDLNTIGGSQSIFTEIRTTEVTTTNSPYEGYGTLLSLKDGSGIAKMQFLGSYDSSVLYFRSQQKAGADITSAWKTIAFMDSNVASATKLQTPRTLWGNDFDGTADVNGNLLSDVWRIIKDYTWNGTFIQSANYDGTSDLGNIYMSARHGNKLTSFNVWANNSKFSDNVTVAGNVGIGNESPTEKLDVTGNVKASGDITANKFIGSIRGNIIYDNGTDEGHFIGLGSNGVGVKGLLNYVYGNFPILFYTNGFERMRIGEYVGIGTASPSERLDVSGNIKASGDIQCSHLIPTGVIHQLNNNSYIVHNAVSNGDHKMWITDGTGKSISAGNAFNLDAINIISDKSLVLGAQLDYNIRVLKANNRIAKVIDSDNYSTLLPYKTPVAISNTYSSNPHNVAMADNTLYIVYENESDDRGCTILSFPTNDGSTPLTCGLLYTTYADATGEFSCPTVIWSYNITPLMEPEATFEMWFTSYDGGTTWYGTHTVYK